MSLWDMINGDGGDYVKTVLLIKDQIKALDTRSGMPVSGNLQAEILASVDKFKEVAERLEMPFCLTRLGRLEDVTRRGESHHVVYKHIETFWQTLDDEATKVKFYRYPEDKAKTLERVEADWAATMASFKSTKRDIVEGVDCYACGHSTASVFHMMRVAERGLWALLEETAEPVSRRGKVIPTEMAQWGELMDSLDAKLKAIRGWPASRSKEAASAFYSAARSHMAAFKTEYRDRVSHSRATYEEPDALIAMFRVRTFMNGLSEKLDESAQPIVW